MTRTLAILMVAALLAAAPVIAQQPAGPLDREYRLVVGDSIKVVVQELDIDYEYAVPGNGEVSFPPLGKLRLLDRSLAELEKELGDRLIQSGHLTDPRVYVLITQNAPREVFLMGAVSAAISLPVYESFTIVQVLAKAGVSGGAADIQHIKILRKRPDGVMFPIYINVEDVLIRNDFQKNVVVMPDDIIYIPTYESVTSTASVYILGKVGSPGRYTWTPGREQMTLAILVALSGDFTQFAKQSAVRILRKEGNRTRPIDIDFSDIIDNEIQDVVLEPDDLIFVPESPW